MTSIPEIFESMSWGPAPESAKPAQDWLLRHDGKFGLYVNGAWWEPKGAQRFATTDPATGKKLADITQASAVEVDVAVKAARRAQPGWHALGGHARARHLYALARAVQRNSRLLAVVETLDNGKPIRESRDIDIPLVARHFYHHAGWAQLMSQEMPDAVPVGVVGQIIPWNFPLLMLAWKIAPALAMGNTVVLKPAEFTSLTALLFAELAHEAGLPPGVLNIITGDGRTGAALVEHPGVDKIAFTGSTDVGRVIRTATAGSGKKLSLELGGKSPFLVLEGADLDSVVEGVVDAIWFNQGQVCCAGSRILVQESMAAPLTAKLRARMETLRVGDPLDKAVDIGAIVAPVQLERIQKLVKQGEEEGAKLWQPSWSVPKEGMLLSADPLHRGGAGIGHRAGGDLRPGGRDADLPRPRRGGGARQQHPLRARGEHLDRQHQPRPRRRAEDQGGDGLDQLHQRLRRGERLRRVPGERIRAGRGKEGLREYVKAAGRSGGRAVRKTKWQDPTKRAGSGKRAPGPPDRLVAIDRTAKLYVGGKQVRPDSGYSTPVYALDGRVVGEVGTGNRKDIRNAVEAAHKASGWGRATAHTRAQVLYYLGENLSARAAEFAARIAEITGVTTKAAGGEVEASIRRLWTYAAWADKWDGQVHHTPYRNVTLAMPEPIGVLGIACPREAPLLGLVSVVAPAIALGNTTVVVPSERAPLVATDLYQVFETSDLPAGVVNIVTGPRDELSQVLAAHDDVDGIWYFGSRPGSAAVEKLSAGNLKRTWVSYGIGRDWTEPACEGREFLEEATQVKNIWIPYGE